MKIETRKKGIAKKSLHVEKLKAIEVKTDAITHHSLVTPSGCESTKRQSRYPYPAKLKCSSAISIPKSIDNESNDTSASNERKCVSARWKAPLRFASVLYSRRKETKDNEQACAGVCRKASLRFASALDSRKTQTNANPSAKRTQGLDSIRRNASSTKLVALCGTCSTMLTTPRYTQKISAYVMPASRDCYK